MRQYKYFMLFCKADGCHSTKYALECLYQFFLIHGELSQRDSERFIRNRSINNHGKKGYNIPLDEATEHSNQLIVYTGPPRAFRGPVANLFRGPNVLIALVALSTTFSIPNFSTLPENADISSEKQKYFARKKLLELHKK
jgi:hypothetical protein